MSPDPTSPTPTQMSLWGASRVSPTHTQDFKKENQTPDISGRKCLDLSKNVGPLGLLEKTLLESRNWAWTKYSLTWRTKATPQGRLIFQLVRLAPPTSGSDSGLLHTPTAIANQMSPSMVNRDKGSWGRIWPTPTGMTGGEGVAPSHRDGKHGWNTAAAVNDAESPTPTRMWPTPEANERNAYPRMTKTRGGKQSVEPNLAGAVKMWPTPRVSSANGVAQSEVDKGDPKRRLEVTVQVEQPQTTGKLNPKWVAWLMGYPTEYLDSVPWETRSSRKSQRK